MLSPDICMVDIKRSNSNLCFPNVILQLITGVDPGFAIGAAGAGHRPSMGWGLLRAFFLIKSMLKRNSRVPDDFLFVHPPLNILNFSGCVHWTEKRSQILVIYIKMRNTLLSDHMKNSNLSSMVRVHRHHEMLAGTY